MTFRGKPTVTPAGNCWCGAEAVWAVYREDDMVLTCTANVFHVPDAEPTYVRVEVTEGRAYTYLAYEDPPLRPGEWVLLPGNEVHSDSFAGKVLRVLDGPDKGYDGPYKAVLGRLL